MDNKTYDSKFILTNFKDFDLSYLFNRDKVRQTHREFLSDVFDRVREINCYSDYSYLKRGAVDCLVEGYRTCGKLIENHHSLEILLEKRAGIRESYALHWAFDSLVKNHPLVERAMNYVRRSVADDTNKILLLSTPGKYYAKEDSFNLIDHIEKSYLLAQLVKKRKRIIEVCEFLQGVVQAEGYLDWSLRYLFFNYDLFGMTLLRGLRKKGFVTNNPLIWMHKDFNRLTEGKIQENKNFKEKIL